MELREAYEKAKDGDGLRCNLKDGAGYCIGIALWDDVPFKYAISDQWEITPAEPLSVDKAWSRLLDSHLLTRVDLFYRGFEEGVASGRLERDLELRPLFKVAEGCGINLTDYPPLDK